MKFFALIFFLALFLQQSHSAIIKLNNSQVINQKNGLTRLYKIDGQYDDADQAVALYRKHYVQANPYVPAPFITILEEAKKKDTPVFKGIYHTGELGLRVTPGPSPKATEHLIIGGDSNVFGIGVEDNETLPYFLGENLKKYSIINFGLAGSGPSNTLYFLQNISLTPVLKNKLNGVFLYDFQPYLFERVIGSKNFIKSNSESPRYEMAGDNLKYKGNFKYTLTTLFYSVLNKLPYGEVFFPNLPRINRSHIELTARVFAEMKKEYLKQTSSSNRFVVAINPTFKKPYKKELSIFIECLAKEHIEMITFDDVPKFHLPRFKDEGHYTKEAHKIYAEILKKKLEARR